ncbi:MAG: hemolysin family protein [Bilifractor sp.]
MILIILLIILSAVFSACEASVLALTDVQMEEMEKASASALSYVRKLKENPGRFLTSVHTLITLCMAGSIAMSAIFAFRMTSSDSLPVRVLSVCIAVFLLTVILMLVSDLLPKGIARKNPVNTACSLSGFVWFFMIVFFPLIAGITGISNAIFHLMGIDPASWHTNVTEDEIKMMVDRGTAHGNIDTDEQEMIRNVFEFDDISIEEICTHRKDVACLYEEDPLEEWEKTIHESRHDQFPVVRETPDHVLGILDAKDYFRLQGASQKEIMERAVDPAYFVPGSVKADVMFQHMKTSGNYFAVVVDEYGGMDGVVTMKDLLEVLVGDLTEDDETEEPDDIIKISPTTWRIQGGAALDEVGEALGKDLPTEEYDTFGGYILGRMGYVPEDGSHFELDADGMHIRVYRIEDHRVENTLVTMLPEKIKTDRETDK